MGNKVPIRLIIFSLLAMFTCLGLGLTALYVQTRPDDFPYGETIRLGENCGTSDVRWQNGGLLIIQNRCILTEQTSGQIYMWYLPRGRTTPLEQVYIVETDEMWVEIISTKRVDVTAGYRGEDKRLIEIYHVTSIIPPSPLIQNPFRSSSP